MGRAIGLSPKNHLVKNACKDTAILNKDATIDSHMQKSLNFGFLDCLINKKKAVTI